MKLLMFNYISLLFIVLVLLSGCSTTLKRCNSYVTNNARSKCFDRASPHNYDRWDR